MPLDPLHKKMFELMGGEKKGELHTPQEWARLAWSTAFVCKRTQLPKVESSCRNAENKAVALLEKFYEGGLVNRVWVWKEDKLGYRLVYGR